MRRASWHCTGPTAYDFIGISWDRYDWVTFNIVSVLSTPPYFFKEELHMSSRIHFTAPCQWFPYKDLHAQAAIIYNTLLQTL